jgi:Uma2 family endonuclease
MISPAKPRLLTADEFHRIGALGVFGAEDRLELHDGVIVDMAPLGNRHILRVVRLGRLFVDAVGDRALVSVQSDMRVSERRSFVPDLALYRPESDAYFLQVGFRAQDALLVIEVADTTLALDSGYKADAYAAAGIPDYWVVDLNGGHLLVHREPTPTGYRIVYRSHRGESVAPLAFPDLAVPVEIAVGPPPTAPESAGS